MSPWLLNVYMDGVVRVVNARERAGTVSVNGGRFQINKLLFAADTKLVADSEK